MRKKKGKIITSDEFLYIISERKKKIINEFNLLIMGSAFDCSLNYEDNIKKESRIICSDYNTKNRDEFLYTPNIEDTIDTKYYIEALEKTSDHLMINFGKLTLLLS